MQDSLLAADHALPDWIGYQQGRDERFQSVKLPPFPSLTWRDPGSLGQFPAQGPHRPARAEFPHAVLQAVDSLFAETFKTSQFNPVHRYPSLFREHSTGFHCTLCVSHRWSYGPMSPFPPLGPIRSGSPASPVL